MKMSRKTNIPLAKSFKCALRGLLHTFRTERNIRIHFCAFFYVVWFSRFYDFNCTQIAVLAIAIGFVIVSELLNTAVETVVDLVSPEKNNLAGLAKDIAAGGVFVSAVTAVVVGVKLFYNKEKIRYIFDYYTSQPLLIALFALTIILWTAIIFLPNFINKRTSE